MKRSVAALVGVAFASLASGKDLIGVYQDALRFDAQIQQAQATLAAAREANPEAWAALLPQLSGSYAVQRQKQVTAQDFIFPGPSGTNLFAENSTTFTTTHGYQLQLQETLFSWANLANLAQAHKKVAEAEAQYRAAQEDLIQRTATAYFNVLNAKDTLDAQQASLDALTQQLEQANKRFQVGLIAITDVKEAEAAHDSAAAAVIQAKRNLANMEEALREITAQDYASLSKPGDSMPLLTPHPASADQWVATSMDQNLSLISSRLAADVAREQVSIAFGGHLPTINLTGTRSDESTSNVQSFEFGPAGGNLLSGGPIGYPGRIVDNQIGLEISVPIFSGGLVHAQTKQAQYQWIAAKDQVQYVSRQTEHQARDAYDGVVSEVAQVEALKQGVVSAETALKATEAGYQVGTRTEVEVLQERQNLVQAQTNYAQARYSYLLDIIQLRLAAGTLDAATLKQIDHWLTVDQPIEKSPVTQPTPGMPTQP